VPRKAVYLVTIKVKRILEVFYDAENLDLIELLRNEKVQKEIIQILTYVSLHNPTQRYVIVKQVPNGVYRMRLKPDPGKRGALRLVCKEDKSDVNLRIVLTHYYAKKSGNAKIPSVEMDRMKNDIQYREYEYHERE
jgi:hypothetical protein